MQVKTETLVGSFILVALGIFFYMTFFLGVFRVDRFQYNRYFVYFTNVSGLEKKADVKIAGVKVGWVEHIDLIDSEYQVKALILVYKNYILRADAQAIVRQDGILNGKYLELLPGDPLLSCLPPETSFDKPGKSPTSIDEILHKVEGIASHVDRTLLQNGDSIAHIISDFKTFAHDLADRFPSVDRDISNVAFKLESTSVALEDAALQARNGFKNISCIAEKIDEGKGLIGKLINEDETYHDLRYTAQGIKKYFSKIEELNIVFDSHSEYMYSPAERLNFENAKGYLDIRIHPNDDHFYLVQILNTERGNIKRAIKETKWFDERCVEIIPSEFVNLQRQSVFIPELVGTVEKRTRKLDQLKFGIEFGKIYKDIAFRIGIIESSAGFGVDVDIPFGTDKFRWITTFEMFDVRGRDRIDDPRPHLKWINRVFLLRNVYFVAGADDFISKENATGFVGAGIRFCDDDIKYFLSSLALFGIGAGA